MALTNDFMNKQQERVEKETFHSIDKLGLRSFSEEAYRRFIKILDTDESHITKNAYLLQFASFLDNLEDITPTSSQNISPKEIEKILKTHELRPAIIISGYGSDHMEKLGHNGRLSDDLYAAAMASSALQKNKQNGRLSIMLIGKTAADLAETSDKILENGLFFNTPKASPEVKTLHLAGIIKQMNTVLKAFNHEIESKKSLSTNTADFALRTLIHVDSLQIDSAGSELEKTVNRKYQIIRNDLDTHPIASANTIYKLPNHNME